MPSKIDDLWNAFTSCTVGEWPGLWTRWDVVTRQVTSSFKSKRRFKAVNDDKTIIEHRNTYTYKDGSVEERGPWEIRKDEVTESGIYHPHIKLGRTVLHSDGSGALFANKLLENESFKIELFLQKNNLRYTSVVVYSDSNQPEWFSAVRETSPDAQTNPWSSDTELAESLQFPDEDFIGIEKDLNDKLDLKVATDCKWNRQKWDKEENEKKKNVLFFLPDSFCLCCPADLTQVKSFSVAAFWFFSCGAERQIHEISVTFSDGQCVSVKQGIYHPVNIKK